MKVSQMTNDKGRAMPNQFIIHTPEAAYFQSYNSIIVKTTFEEGKRKVYLDEVYYNYSKTTSKYRNQFLGETTKETEKKIKSGEYELINLQSEV